MATAPRSSTRPEIEYPSSDGRPMAETQLHLWVMVDLIQALAFRYDADPMVYVGGDLLVYYEEGKKNKRLAPDVFVVFGVSKTPPRDHFLIWEEGKAPDVVIEVTSKTTRSEDQTKKRILYRDAFKVPEYFQFDPTEDYLRPSLQGARLHGGAYRPIETVAGRLPSDLLGPHFERSGTSLKLYDPTIGRHLAVPSESMARAARESARAARESARATSAEAENDRLRRELEELRGRLAGGS